MFRTQKEKEKKRNQGYFWTPTVNAPCVLCAVELAPIPSKPMNEWCPYQAKKAKIKDYYEVIKECALSKQVCIYDKHMK